MLERKAGSVFVSVPQPQIHPPTDAESRLMVASDEYEETWNGVTEHMKSLVSVPATHRPMPTAIEKSQKVTPTVVTPSECKMTAEGHRNDRFLNKIEAYLKTLAKWVTPDEVFARFRNKYNLANLEDIKAGLTILVETGRAKAKCDNEKDLYASVIADFGERRGCSPAPYGCESKPRNSPKSAAVPEQPETTAENECVPGAAENIRVYRIGHLGDLKDKLIYEAPSTEDDADIFKRAQAYANRTGYVVSCVRQNPHLIRKFRPAVWRENPDTPSVVDPNAPPAEKLRGLGWYAKNSDGAMFFDDREQIGRLRFKRRDSGNIIAWLNKSQYDGWWLNIVKKDVLCLTKPIPRCVDTFSDAITWVMYHAEWRCADA